MPGKQFQKTATVVLLVCLCLLSALPAMAQRIIIDPPIMPPLPPQQSPITIDLHSIDALVDGPLATVHVTQIFHNISGVTVEGKYVFPLPAEAAVSDFQMTVDGQVMEGKLYTAEEARRIYEEIVRSLRDPALLEYLGSNLFQASVFPIPAGATRKIELTYTQVLPLEDGLYRLHLPLGAAQTATAKVDKLAIRVELRNQPGLRTVYSPNFNLDIQRQGDDGALIGYESAAEAIRGDFDLYFGADTAQIGVNLLTYKPSGEDGYFLLLAAPSVEVAQQEIVSRDVVVVLDTSGSMQGEKIEQARKAVRFVVQQLNPGDRFNLISFSTGTRLWQAQLQEVNETTLANAQGWIDQITASGSTDINRALLEAMAQFAAPNTDTRTDTGADSGRPAYLLFMTDGLPTQGETNAELIIKNVQQNLPAKRDLRLFSFGVGYDVNTDLLDTLSGDLGGRTTYVTPDEAIDEKVGNFYAQIGKPVLADVKLDFGPTAVVDELYPYPLPDLFAGEQQVIVGRYRQGATVDVTLQGSVNGKAVTFSYPGRTLANAGGEPFIARIWATRKIGDLLTQIRRNGPQSELIDAIVELSLKYGIVTPYTSYLVQEPTTPVFVQPAVGEENPAPLQYSYDKSVANGAEQLREQTAAEAQAAPSGESAVAASVERDTLRQTSVVGAAQPNLQFAGGRTFTHQGIVELPDGLQVPLWVDTLFVPSMQVETVAFGSERYFELAAQDDLASAFSLSSEVVVVTGAETAIRVSNSGGETAPIGNAPAEATQVESPLASPTPVVSNRSEATATPAPSPTPEATPDASEKGWLQNFWDWMGR